MSLLGTLHIANNSLRATQIGLQVAGNNISNANTPGYVRQEVAYSPAETQLLGGLPLGLGVRVDGIFQQIDQFLAERRRGSLSDVENSSTQEQYYLQLETILGELGESDLSTSLNSFFGAIHDVLNQPEDPSVRNLAVLQGQTLVSDIDRIDRQIRDLQSNLNEQVSNAADEINRLLDEIAELNVKIIQIEGSSTLKSQAVGLRDQREVALQELAGLIGIRVVEQEDGAASVFAGGEYLVFEGHHREVTVSQTVDDTDTRVAVHITETDSPLVTATGRLAGIYAARDEVLGAFSDRLTEFTGTLTFEFNKVYSSGQGLSGFTELTGAHAVADADTALDQAGLEATPGNGSFQVQVRNQGSNIFTTTDVIVDLNGLDEDITLTELVSALDAIDGISALVTPELQVQITSDSSNIEFNFANDTSGVLAALGLNVFFTGARPGDLGISSVVREDAGKFAASQGGIGNDSDNAVRLAAVGDTPLESHDGASLLSLYDELVSETTQAAAVSRAVTEGFRVFHGTLESQHLSVSGVNVDDEAVKIIGFQRVYQASARLISTISDLLDTLINL